MRSLLPFHVFIKCICFGVAVFLLPTTAFSITLVPTDLSPGDKYQLAFLTNTTRDATSENIDDYNAFVQSVADAAGIGSNSPIGPITWKAIGSTATVAARDNALVSAPVYRLDLFSGLPWSPSPQTLVATGFADFWDGSLVAPLNVGICHVWTGSSFDGRALFDRWLGSLGPQVGLSGFQNSWWISNDFYDPGLSSTIPTYFYSLSEELTVIPEPSTIILMSCGLLGLLGICVKRRRKEK